MIAPAAKTNFWPPTYMGKIRLSYVCMYVCMYVLRYKTTMVQHMYIVSTL